MAELDKKYFVNKIKREMKRLGTYKKEYNSLIDIFGGMLFQYQVFENEFAESGYTITEDYTNKAGATNQRKVPIYTAMESLRKDIATYSDKLCLNPKALEVVTTETKEGSLLVKALRDLE